ncbi:MAG: TonB-dependent receptor plug domain-containing protein, partial [bacterium]|nr:TonB-dependent receptor plug domain-containing protein [bacterium]
MSRILSAVLLTILTAPALAQSECESLLGDAARSYEAGRLDDAVALAEDCLSEEASKAEKILAYGLLARTYLELDRLDAADAALAELLRLDPDFEPDRINDPSVFIHRLEEAKKARAEFRISSVSKTLESLREAPATVVVLTAEEIRRRGYHDLEALVHDLSGFDVTRTNGATYSNLYQRGYRSDLTTRTALLVDGVVENDIWSQAAYLSRQYPLSNVERVEVIYGPASTMYGANAFAGVINIVTKDPGEVLAPGKRFAVEAQVAGGTWNTRYLDATAMGRSKNEAVSWSLTARKYQSDEMDLSGYDDWDWDPAFYESAELAGTYREQLSFDAATGNQTVDEYINEICTEDKVLDRGCVAGVRGSGYFDVTERGIALTDDGRRRAIELDQALLGQEFDGLTAGYEDLTDAWLLHGKLWSPNLILGFQTWKKKEGWPSRRTDQVSFGKRTWIPVQTWSYLRYSLPIGENLFLTLFTRYREHELDGQTRTIEVEKNYALGTLGIADLATETEGSLRKRYWYLRNSQFVNELKLVYSSPGARFHLVAGLEHRRGWVQGNYVFSREP